MPSQPGCSHSGNTESSTKSFRLSKIKTKTKKDFSNKFKRNVANEKKIRKQISPKIQKKQSGKEEERKKLREICIETKSDEKVWKEETGAGPSKGATFIVHNFAKNGTFVKCKFKKHSLRRLTKSTPDAGKVDKVKKRKKLKK